MLAWQELIRQAGSVDQSVDIVILSTSTTPSAQPKTGLTYASAGAAVAWRRGNGALSTGTLVTQTPTGVHADYGFCEVQSTNMPGVYRLDLPDGVFAAGVDEVTVVVQFTGCHPAYLKITLTEYDPNAAGPTEAQFAQEVLKADWTGITGEASRSMLNAFRTLRNRWYITGTTLTVTKEDDTTTAFTAALSTSATAEGITAMDPS